MAARDDIAKRAARRPSAPEAAAPTNDLAARLARGKELRRRTRWPGSEIAIDLVPLTYALRAEAIAEALAALSSRGIDGGNPARELVQHSAAEEIVQILARSIRDPETGEQVFRSGAELGAAATEDEISWLWTEYSSHRQAVDPEREELPEEELERFLEASKKKDAIRGDGIALSWPKHWLHTAAVRLANSLTSSASSTTSPAAATSSDSSSEAPPAAPSAA